MTDVQFGRLHDLPLREAWKHEARSFTPWLAENIDHLAEVIGVPLELAGTEVAVGSFAADILARNRLDDSLVLIENQLEEGDHGHLGQIMTYLAGLEAQTVVWIAPSFREPHLSAIRWLNEHTAEDFSFFAVRLRVVRIGESPFAPIFEVAEKPNDWDRQLKQTASTEGSGYYDVKQSFWRAFLDSHPEFTELGVRPWRYPNNYISVSEVPRADISIYLARHESGIYLRSGRGEPSEPLSRIFEPHRSQLEVALGTDLGPTGRGGFFLVKAFPKGHEETADWPEIIQWMVDQVEAYRTALVPVFAGEN
ncbi:MAG: hypothetical protein KDE24_37085 [Caldilinea sp.]|nr:hypothetical protein [Caldilinea sp.]